LEDSHGFDAARASSVNNDLDADARNKAHAGPEEVRTEMGDVELHGEPFGGGEFHLMASMAWVRRLRSESKRSAVLLLSKTVDPQ
jgi:hypothetical protein